MKERRCEFESIRDSARVTKCRMKDSETYNKSHKVKHTNKRHGGTDPDSVVVFFIPLSKHKIITMAH